MVGLPSFWPLQFRSPQLPTRRRKCCGCRSPRVLSSQRAQQSAANPSDGAQGCPQHSAARISGAQSSQRAPGPRDTANTCAEQKQWQEHCLRPFNKPQLYVCMPTCLGVQIGQVATIMRDLQNWFGQMHSVIHAKLHLGARTLPCNSVAVQTITCEQVLASNTSDTCKALDTKRRLLAHRQLSIDLASVTNSTTKFDCVGIGCVILCANVCVLAARMHSATRCKEAPASNASEPCKPSDSRRSAV